MNKQTKRMMYLAEMLNKYAHRWSDCPSRRMYSWVDEYNETKRSMQEAGTWKAYCEEHGFDRSHDAYDCMA
jgi:hypothetical protein